MEEKKNQSNTIKINGEDVLYGDVEEMWLEAGVCRDCIDYRFKMNNTFIDSYEAFAHLHSEDCLCD